MSHFTHIPLGMSISLCNIYMLVVYQEKMECSRSLINNFNVGSPPLIFAGKINTTLSQNERKGGSRVHDLGREFLEDMIAVHDLIDVKPNRGKFTWKNRRIGPNHIAAMLDRFLIGSSLLDCHISPSSRIFPWSISNHHPISLDLSPSKYIGPIPFLFNLLWLHNPDFLTIILEAWNCWIIGNPSSIWDKKKMHPKRLDKKKSPRFRKENKRGIQKYFVPPNPDRENPSFQRFVDN
jgi:hypothetical protein